MIKKRVALFGGSFNPIHNSHLKVVRYVVDKKIVDEAWLIPCKKHPLDKKLVDAGYRIDMLKLAIKKFPKIKVCDIELKMKGKSYTFKTVTALKKKYPNYDFFFVVGSDILQHIQDWYGYEALRKEIGFIVFKRRGFDFIKVPGLKIEKEITYGHEATASNKIRKMIKNKNWKALYKIVPKEVVEYIKKNNLYSSVIS